MLWTTRREKEEVEKVQVVDFSTLVRIRFEPVLVIL
jgi:hypothetical protein